MRDLMRRPSYAPANRGMSFGGGGGEWATEAEDPADGSPSRSGQLCAGGRALENKRLVQTGRELACMGPSMGRAEPPGAADGGRRDRQRHSHSGLAVALPGTWIILVLDWKQDSIKLENSAGRSRLPLHHGSRGDHGRRLCLTPSAHLHRPANLHPHMSPSPTHTVEFYLV